MSRDDFSVIRNARAFLFDFDGVVADTETVHFRTFAQTLAEREIIVTKEEHALHYMGIDDSGCFRLAHDRASRATPSQDEVNALLSRKSELYENALDEIDIFPGFHEVFAAARARGPHTIGSSGRRRDIETVLRHHGLTDAFPSFISADELDCCKPDPECYLRALAIVREHDSGIQASDCVVIEDSVRGVEAAKRAGMSCVALTHSFPAEKLQHADLVLNSWTDWSWD